MLVSFNSNMTGLPCGAGTANSSGAHKFTTDVSGVCVAQSLVFCVVFCGYPTGIFKLFLNHIITFHWSFGSVYGFLSLTINVIENQMGNLELIIQRHGQYRTQETKRRQTKQNPQYRKHKRKTPPENRG